MVNNREPDLDYAKACLARAKRHRAEFRDLTAPNTLWRIVEGCDDSTGEWFARLHLNGQQLVAANPVLADCANNAASALDHIAAALARANGREREDCRRLYFPWAYGEVDFQKRLAQVEVDIGPEASAIIAKARDKHQINIPSFEAAKQISNCGKHWALVPAVGKAAAVGVDLPDGGRKFFELPRDAFQQSNFYEFYRGAARLPNGPCVTVVNLTVDGLEGDLPNGVDAILDCSLSFVEGVIHAVGEAVASDG